LNRKLVLDGVDFKIDTNSAVLKWSSFLKAKTVVKKLNMQRIVAWNQTSKTILIM
jgi:hypothetical protein